MTTVEGSAGSLNSPSPLAGEGGPKGRVRDSAASAAQKTIVQQQSRKSLLIERARYMRANPTDAERKLWYPLRDRRRDHMKWRRQFIVDDRDIVDFVCLAHRLIVEAEGSQHADSRNDTRRDHWLKSEVFTVLRFWNSEILTKVDGIADAIMVAAQSFRAKTRATAHPPTVSRRAPLSPARGEGF